MVLSFDSLNEILSVTIQKKATEQYVPVVLFFMLFKVVEILQCEEGNRQVLYLPLLYSFNFIKAFAVSDLSKLATNTEQVYWPTSFSETFVICREKLPLSPGSHFS